MTMQRYIIQKSTKPNNWVCTDTVNLIVATFEHRKFNDTQKIEMLQNFDPANYMKLASLLREMGEWLFEKHPEKIQ